MMWATFLCNFFLTWNKEIPFSSIQLATCSICSFKIGYRAHRCLVNALDKWKDVVDNERVFGAILNEISKTFDSFSRILKTNKLNAYGFSLAALKGIYDYLSNSQQSTMTMIIVHAKVYIWSNSWLSAYI